MENLQGMIKMQYKSMSDISEQQIVLSKIERLIEQEKIRLNDSVPNVVNVAK